MNQTKEVSTLLGDPKKAVLKMSIPMMVAMVINSLYAFIDSVWVAGLGDMALAAIGFVNPVYMVIFGISNGLGAGATAVISKYIGAQNKKEADNSAMHVLILTIILSIIFTILVLIFLKPILIAMGAGPTVNLGLEYGNIFFLGTIFVVFSATAFGILRAEGNVKKTTYAMVVGAVLNIILDPIFIYTLNLGVAGAAYASVLSMAIVCLLLSYWFIKDTYINFNFKEFIYKNKIVKEILSIGLPAGVEFFFISMLAIAINAILMFVSGVDGVAVYTGGWRFVAIIMVIPIAIGTSTIAITGANLGAGKFKNIEIAHSYGIKFGTLIVLLISIAIFILAPYISYLFAYSPGSERLLEPMTVFLRITCLFYLFFPLGVVSSSVFQGLGKGLNSLMIAFIRALLLQIVFSYIFAVVLNLGQVGVWYGIVFGNAVGGIIAYIWSKSYIKKLIPEDT
ncbi:MATE family efflux transporter [Methanobrevibacter sp. OttesenSCG-928-K11]|nr:MATE family efflux transporter [Methanobrevibacter sp. OttesenSCG-928-K11]MDL2271312.1 MATE family efflux transporter [Methanobrevibacter sp. OttesenSCG-928-I08]